MRISNYLFISENFVGGGLETRIHDQIQVLEAKGIQFFLIAKNYNNKYNYLFKDVNNDIDFTFNNISISSSLKMIVDKIVKYCVENKIDFIDCHPFNCLLPSVIVANKLNIPISYTIHGKSSLFYANNEQQKIKLLNDISLLCGVNKMNVVCDYLKEEINDCIKSDVVKNGVMSAKTVSVFSNNKRWAIISRLDKIKSKLVIESLSCLMDSDIEYIDIIGDGDCVDAVLNEIKLEKYKSKVKYIGWIDDVPNYLITHNYDGVIGMGRVVLEAMSVDIPCVLLGYGGLAGAINKEKYLLFSRFNFTYYSNYKKEDILKEIKSIYDNPNQYRLKEIVDKNNNSSIIWNNYLQNIESINRKSQIEIEKISELIEKKLIEKLNLTEIFKYIYCDDIYGRYKFIKYFYKSILSRFE